MSSLIPPISIKTVITCLLWYFVSSITSQLTKLILTKFQYPLFLSQCQFLIGALLSYTFITIVKQNPIITEHFPKGSVPQNSNTSILSIAMFLKILPLGLFQFVGKYFSLSATSLIPLPTVSSIKALSPLLIVLGYRVIYKVLFPMITYLSLAPLLLGVILIITSGTLTSASLLTNENNKLDERQIRGIVLCFISTFVFAAQNIYGKQLITWDNESNDKPVNPASLVLNTELTRPSTPMLNGNSTPTFPITKTIFDSEKLSPDYFNQKSRFNVRQRSNSIKLPYSTSDLTLDEMKENHILTPPIQQNSYQTAINENQNIYNPFQYLISKFELDKVSKPDKLTLIFYSSLIGLSFSVGGFIFKELPSMYQQIKLNDQIETPTQFILLLILLDSLSHFMQTLLAFHLLGSIPALSYSIASMLKRIVLITTSIIFTIGYSTPNSDDKWLGKITTQQIIGLVLIGFGLYCYDKWGSRSLKPDRS